MLAIEKMNEARESIENRNTHIAENKEKMKQPN